jgi:hypothetical protein
MKKDCVINGVTYTPEIQEGFPNYSFAWDGGLVIFILRRTQFNEIFYLRMVKIGWKWPPFRSVSIFGNEEMLKH